MPKCWAQIDYSKKTTCKDWQDYGEDVCSSWSKQCTSWLPSWLGGFCRITGWVCTGLTHVFNWICVGWNYLTVLICVIIDVTVAGLHAVVSVLETIFGRVLAFLGVVLLAAFALPVIGPILRTGFHGFQEVLAFVLSLPDIVLGGLGILPEKKLRVCTLILDPSVNQAEAVWALTAAAKIFKEQANIRLIGPVDEFVAPYYSPFGDEETPSEKWVKDLSVTEAPNLGPTQLKQSCGPDGFIRNIGNSAKKFELIRQVECASYASWRQWIGYGAPITAFFITEFIDGKIGCCFPLSAMVFVEPVARMPAPNFNVLAHELGHACNLPHINELDVQAGIDIGRGLRRNLMFSSAPAADPVLYKWQVLLMRASRHVTYV